MRTPQALTVLILFSILGTGITRANEPPDEIIQIRPKIEGPGNYSKEMRGHASELIQELMATGITQVGALSLPKLLRQTQKVRTEIGKHNLCPGLGDRCSAFYEFGRKMIFLNERDWQMLPLFARDPFALHETLGALGYADENYEISSFIWLLNSTSPAERAELLAGPFAAGVRNLRDRIPGRIYNDGSEAPTKVPARYKPLPILAGGGSTGVAGGGDWHSLQMRLRLMRDADAFYRQLREKFPGTPMRSLEETKRRIYALPIETSRSRNDERFPARGPITLAGHLNPDVLFYRVQLQDHPLPVIGLNLDAFTRGTPDELVARHETLYFYVYAEAALVGAETTPPLIRHRPETAEEELPDFSTARLSTLQKACENGKEDLREFPSSRLKASF